MHQYEHTQSSSELDRHTAENAYQLGSLSVGGTVELQKDNEMDNLSFELTEPESRTYSPYENYRFLVHVVSNDVEKRATEIGSPRGSDILMASLVSNKRTATFQGEGGIILAEPQPELVMGVAAFDIGGVNHSGSKVDFSELVTPGSNDDYNQVDMKFEATQPIGVMIKRAASDGHELGNARKNMALREYAAQRNLPVAEVLVLPDILPSKITTSWEQLEGGNRLLTVDVPDTSEQYYRIQVLHGQAYGMQADEDTMGRVMKISAYGEAPQELSPQQREKALEGLRRAAAIHESGVTKKDIDTIERDLDRLEAERAQQ